MTQYKITDRLFFDDIGGCRPSHDDAIAIVHACKEPCHRAAVNYTDKSLPATHPNYLSYAHGTHLYLNLIDPPKPLFKLESFDIFFKFVDTQMAVRPVLIHCNKGESRAPSLALLYAAKRLHLFSNKTYADARAAFKKQFPYKPGAGIAIFLAEHWQALG